MTEAIRVLVVDDHTVVREGIKALLAAHPEFEPVGEARDGLEAVSQARLLKPDVILMDLIMPRKGGIEAIRDIKAENHDVRILVFTSFAEDGQVFPAIKMGASGYILKDSDPGELFRAIRDVHRGEAFLHPTIAAKLVKELNQPPAHPLTEAPLTERELEVLKLVAQGLSNQDIAGSLVVSEPTVRAHVSSILSKLHLANRTQAALYALREGLAKLDGREQ
jgi:NarL family two-component system response regulator LiaR